VLEFSQEELDQFSKDYIELSLEALDRGQLEEAREYLRRHDRIKNKMHDAYLVWIGRLMAHIYQSWGEDAAVEALKATMIDLKSMPGVRDECVERGGLRAWIETMVDGWRVHGSHPGLTVQEDEEKFTISVQPCGSGGRLIDDGYYDGPDAILPKLQKAGPHTWGETDVPIYCAHCALAHEVGPLESGKAGAQLWVHEAPFPRKKGDPCIHHFYKDPKAIPAHYYERIGLKDKVK